jgi:hypothetical protein
MTFFTSPTDLQNWVVGQNNPNLAVSKILEVIGNDDALSVKQACQQIAELNEEIKKEENDKHLHKEIEDASASLFAVLAKYNVTETKEGSLMNKKTSQVNDFSIREAQVTRPPSSPYTGREDDNKYVGTPWRRDRDAIYDFTHRNPDMLSFDDDPTRVYSGEALWRRYIMDKFYRDYKDEKGRVVGGYINDRFKVYHDLGGNQMELANGERTRKPRPHQYSIERRLEEARGNKTEDILPLRAASDSIRVIVTGSEEKPATHEDIKYASNVEDDFVRVAKQSIEEEDPIAQAFADILEMKTAGLEDKEIILKVSDHYKMPIAKAANIKDFAYKVKENHMGVLYSCEGAIQKEAAMNEEGVQLVSTEEMTVLDDNGAPVGTATIEQNTVLQEIPNSMGKQVFVVKDMNGNVAGSQKLMFPEGMDAGLATKDVGSDIAMDELEGIEASSSPEFVIKEV